MEDAEAFEERFWSGGDLAQLFREVSNRDAEQRRASRTSSNRVSANSPASASARRMTCAA